MEHLYLHTSFEDWLFNCSNYKNKNMENVILIKNIYKWNPLLAGFDKVKS